MVCELNFKINDRSCQNQRKCVVSIYKTLYMVVFIYKYIVFK